MRSGLVGGMLLWGIGLLSGSALAQEKSPPTLGDLNIYRWLSAQTHQLAERAFAGVHSRQEWERLRPKLREQFLDMLGLWPLPERTPLKATLTGVLEQGPVRIEKLHFQSRPRLYVTANFYLPRDLRPGEKLPAVLYLCGHANRGRDGNKTAYQHHALWFATHGYACLVLDTLQLGEIAGVHHGTYREGRWWWHAAGYTPAGVECWNGIRALDYLCSRPEVDPERLAVTGRSGGGAYTVWVAAADERVRVAVPVSGFTDLETHIVDHVLQGHCDCMYPYNIYRWDFSTILGLIAPRPLLFLNSSNDTIFPMPGNERLREQLQWFYGLFTPRVPDRFEFGVIPGPHRDELELRLLAYRWINRHLKNDPRPVTEPELPLLPGRALRVFPEDRDLPADALNARIDEYFVPQAQVSLPAQSADLPAWREKLLSQLRQRVFTDWPEPVPAARLINENAKTGELLLSPDTGLVVAAHRLERQKGAKASRLVLVILDEKDTEKGLPSWAQEHVGPGDEVLVLAPRGIGRLAWTRRNPPNYVERAHALLGRTVDMGRVWDIQAVLRWWHEQDSAQRPLVVLGHGQGAVLAAYAALWEPAVHEVIAVAPTHTHRAGPYFLGILRILDVPEALGLLAPRRLSLIGVEEKAFRRTAALYHLAGAADRLRLRP